MGAACHRVYAAPPADERLQKVIEMLNLQKEDVARLHTMFKQYDVDGSGTIDTKEFYELTHERESVFANSIFEIIETNKPQELDFSEFVQALCTYCMFGKEEVLKFCFYIFDKDKNGYIEEDEMLALVRILHENSMNHSLKMAIASLDEDGDGKINFGACRASQCARLWVCVGGCVGGWVVCVGVCVRVCSCVYVCMCVCDFVHARLGGGRRREHSFTVAALARSRVQGHERALPSGPVPRLPAAVEHDAAHDVDRVVAQQARRDREAARS
jgi:Ca2+-binding EF-hand superfamily protein